jgi:RNA polymerase sigma factor FliA
MTKAPDPFRQTAAEARGVLPRTTCWAKTGNTKSPDHQPARPVGDHLAS